MAAFQRSPETVAGYANPLAEAIYNIAGRQIPYPGGTYQGSIGESLQRNLERLAPNVDFVRDMLSPSGEGRYPEDASRLGRLYRELGIVPIEVERWPGRAEEVKKLDEAMAVVGGNALPVIEAFNAKQEYFRAKEGKSLKERAVLLNDIASRRRPDLVPQLGSEQKIDSASEERVEAYVKALERALYGELATIKAAATKIKKGEVTESGMVNVNQH